MKTQAEKLDALLVSTTKLAERQDQILKRMDKFEESAGRMDEFIVKCSLGRRVTLWLLSGLGTVAALAIAFWNALKS